MSMAFAKIKKAFYDWTLLFIQMFYVAESGTFECFTEIKTEEFKNCYIDYIKT